MAAPRLPASPLVLALAVTALLAAVRVAALFASPLELYPDEAQYWLWSRELAWGYYSKPPVVAWLIAASTALGGDGEAWVRLPATLAHAAAGMALFAVGARLYDRWTGFWACVLYGLMPGVQLSAVVMTTDAPLLMFLALALLGYATLLRGAAARTRLTAAGVVGVCLGLALLSKYAALYFIAGLVLHALTGGRRAWTPAAAALAAAAFCLVIAPNLVWNATHEFATVSHTAENADLQGGAGFNPMELFRFLGAQLVVFGPVPFLTLSLGGALLAARRRLLAADAMLLLLAAPALVVVGVEAFLARANANWAAAAYVPGSVLAAAWLVRWRARALLGLASVSQGALAAAFLVALVSPAFVELIGVSNAFKRVRGWRGIAAAVTERSLTQGWSAVVVDDRFLFNALAYYARDTLARPGAPPLRMWVREARPMNQAEATSPLTRAEGARVLVVSLVPEYRAEIRRDFAGWRPVAEVSAPLGGGRQRQVTLAEGSGYARAPRDPVTGLPREP